MDVSFNIFDQHEIPSFTLCNPDKTEIYSLDMCINPVQTLRFNASSELTFTLYEKIDGEDVPGYDYVVNKRLVLVGNSGYFIITDVNEIFEGKDTNKKEVTAMSLEIELNAKKINYLSGTYKFYDVLDPTSTNSVMGKVLSLAPAWSIGTIDSDLWVKYRTFSISDSNIYSFLMDDVAAAYECVFEFDTINREISAYFVDNVNNQTDIYLSFNNLLQEASLTEKSDEISTCLYVYGSGDLDIRTVNPLGTNAIYDFSYYKNSNWMSAGLISSLTTWENLVDANQSDYADYLTDLNGAYGVLIVYQGELVDLENEYLALEGVQKTRIESGLDYSDIKTQLDAKQAEIDAKEIQIENQQNTIDGIIANLQSINDSLSFENNFTETQISELSNFTYENTYQNENFIQTDEMTTVEIQEMAQELYDQAKNVLDRISQPRYEFSMSSASFMLMKDYEDFTRELELGSVVTVEPKEDVIVETVLLEVIIAYEDIGSMQLTFSNRLRLDNSAFVFSDLFGQPIKMGADVSFNSDKWSNWDNTYKDPVSTFITSALDATVNNVINAENQEILINQNGLRGRTYDDITGTYDDEQCWLTSNVLAFTNDNWQTAKAALGKVDVGGSPVYGLVGEVIIGRIIAGNELTISNDDNNFVLDNTGAYLNNASFTITRTDSGLPSGSPLNRITLDPTTGIKIEKNDGGTWNDKFYVDSSGNLNIAGNLTGSTGTFSGAINASSGNIGGWSITTSGLSDSFGNYINSNGNVKLGALTISGSSATFDGNIYASNLIDQVQASQIGSVYAGSIQAGTIYGSQIAWGGASMDTISLGIAEIDTDIGLSLRSGECNIFISSGDSIQLNANTVVAEQFLNSNYLRAHENITSENSLNVSGRAYFNGGITALGYNGLSTNMVVGGAFTAKQLYFTSGILTGWTNIYT